MAVEESRETQSLISVVIVDDHEAIRRGVRNLLENDAAIMVVGEANDGDEAVSIICRLRPKVAIVDVVLRSVNGIEVSKAINTLAPDTRILILTAYDDDRYVSSLMKLGVGGYLLKSSTAQELRDAIHDVAEGKLVFGARVFMALLTSMPLTEQA